MDRPSDSASFLILDDGTADASEDNNMAADEEVPDAATPAPAESDLDDDRDSATENDEWAAFFAQARESSEITDGVAAEIEALSEDIEHAEESVTNDTQQADDRFVDEDSPANDDAEPRINDESDLTAEQIDVTLSNDLDLEGRLALMEPAPERSSGRPGLWIGAAILMVTVLAIQATHYFRSDLANQATVGPLLQSAYRAIGMPITPEWDLTQYEILDWVATARPGLAGEETLNISARIRNNGPRAQPYPSIRLALKDRWEQTVGSRIFKPEEYLPEEHLTSGLMPTGIMAPAVLDVADRSDDAYGFELDVCIEAPEGSFACVSDVVFE
jgi:hypothetical protein